MAYYAFKSKYRHLIDTLIECKYCIDTGTEKWMDLLCETWDGKDPHTEKPTSEEVNRVTLLMRYLEENNVEVIQYIELIYIRSLTC